MHPPPTLSRRFLGSAAAAGLEKEDGEDDDVGAVPLDAVGVGAGAGPVVAATAGGPMSSCTLSMMSACSSKVDSPPRLSQRRDWAWEWSDDSRLFGDCGQANRRRADTSEIALG